MTKLPILYSLREIVQGRGYVAGVSLGNARAISTVELNDEGSPVCWALGVQPDAIAGSGATLYEAFDNLRETFRKYLFDVAASAADFDVFQQEIERFFRQTLPETDREWTDAVAAVRAGTASAPDRLQKVQSSGVTPQLQVVNLLRQQPTPITNPIDDEPSLAA